MKILLGVHQFFPYHYTGTERYVLNLAKQFQRMGHYVEVLTYAIVDREGFSSRDASKVLHKRYTYEGISVTALRHLNMPDNHAFSFDFMNDELYYEARKILEDGAFDLYHCAHPLYITSSIKAAKDLGVKVVLMVTDYWLMCPLGIMLRLDNTLCDGPDEGRNCLQYCFTKVGEAAMQKRIAAAKKLLEYCDCLLSPSQFLIQLFNYAGFISADRFILSRHGFDYSRKKRHSFERDETVITFGYIGTVQHHKGVHIMVEGFRKAHRENMRLQVWGGSFNEVEYEKSVKKIAERDSRIEFMGAYNFNDVENILAAIDVVIVPSIWYENAPLTITTSLAYGIPVVASDIGGMREMVNGGRNGLTFKVGDILDFSKNIDRIASDRATIDSFKKTLKYPIRTEEEAFNTELVYKNLQS